MEDYGIVYIGEKVSRILPVSCLVFRIRSTVFILHFIDYKMSLSVDNADYCTII